jgi:hypothetical protein
MDLGSSREAHRDHLTRYHQLNSFGRRDLTLSQDLIGFRLTNPLYRKELFLGCESDCFNGMISSLD